MDFGEFISSEGSSGNDNRSSNGCWGVDSSSELDTIGSFVMMSVWPNDPSLKIRSNLFSASISLVYRLLLERLMIG